MRISYGEHSTVRGDSASAIEPSLRFSANLNCAISDASQPFRGYLVLL